MLRINNSNTFENPEKIVVSFIDKYDISDFSLPSLERAIRSLGFEIAAVREDDLNECETSSVLVDSVQKCFLYNNDNVKSVFIADNLSEEVRCFCLARVVSLILLDVEDSRNISAKEELFSISFAVYLKDYFAQRKSRGSFQKLVSGFGSYVSAALIAVLSIITVFIYVINDNEFENPLDMVEYSDDSVYIKANSDHKTNEDQTVVIADYVCDENESDIVSINEASSVDSIVSTEENSVDSVENVSFEDNSQTDVKEDLNVDMNSALIYYVTKSGKKYHIESCHYVSDKSKCTALSADEISSSKYEPCKKCIK